MVSVRESSGVRFLTYWVTTCPSHLIQSFGAKGALILIQNVKRSQTLRLLLDGQRRVRTLKQHFDPEIRWRIGKAESGLDGRRELLATSAFEVEIGSLLCMQANPLKMPQVKVTKVLGVRDMFHFHGLPRTKAFVRIEDTISFGEICAALRGELFLKDFLSKIDRFGPDWAEDREPRTIYLVEAFKTVPKFLDFEVSVSVLSDGSLVLQDGHHRVSLALLAGQSKVLARLKV